MAEDRAAPEAGKLPRARGRRGTGDFRISYQHLNVKV